MTQKDNKTNILLIVFPVYISDWFPTEGYKILMTNKDKKRRGNYQLSVPRTEALALPIEVEQTTLEPTPI